MKKLTLSLIALILLTVWNACNDKYTETFRANVPEYMSFDAWRSMDISAQSPQELTEPGKIYVYLDYLFIVEKNKGIHIFNNANPSAPQNIGFLPVLGCVDLAVRNFTLYADSYYDLLGFDISDPANPELSCRIINAFDYDNWTTIGGYQQDLPFTGINPDNGIIVGWRQKEISRDAQPYNIYMFEDMLATADGGVYNNGINTINAGSGMGGSMAQFTITGDYLYVLRPSTITAYDLASDLCPQQSSVTQVSWNAETLFPYNNHLFLGTTSGMIIYNLNNPAQPEFVSQIAHLTACDPVAVQGNRAYVTVRTGTRCQESLNGLMVIDISDYTTPATLAEYELTNPHGLGIDGTTLFICDGSDGLKVFNAEDDLTITDHLISHYQNITTYDVIPYNNVLIMSAEEGIYQYDYSDPQTITELSFIPAN